MITHAHLHYILLRHILNHGHAPELPELAQLLARDPDEVAKALHALQDYHGVVLHPHEPKVWVIHPFSLAPTNFWVTSTRGKWWGNCAWCSLGIAALLEEDVQIATSLGAEGEQVVIHIENGHIRERDLLIHFPIPMQQAWDNVIYTCSNMLVFRDEAQVDAWSVRHHIPKGDIQPLHRFWPFAREWYGRHLDPDWKKWTVDEAKALFDRYSLTHPVWSLGESGERF